MTETTETFTRTVAAFMEEHGMPLATESRKTFTAIRKPTRHDGRADARPGLDRTLIVGRTGETDNLARLVFGLIAFRDVIRSTRIEDRYPNERCVGF